MYTSSNNKGFVVSPLLLALASTTTIIGVMLNNNSQENQVSCAVDESIVKYKNQSMNCNGEKKQSSIKNATSITTNTRVSESFVGKHGGVFDDANIKLDERLAKKLDVFKVDQDGALLFTGPHLGERLIESEIISIPRSHSTGSPELKDIKLYITKPKILKKPCSTIVIQFHGGGMLYLSTATEHYTNCREYLTNEGVVVVGVEFENGVYPRGLNDCIDAVKWVIDHKHQVMGKAGIPQSIVLFGDSGGANLALATSQSLLNSSKQDDYINQIDGIYCSAPYIAGPSMYKTKYYPSYRLYATGEYLLGDSTEKAEVYKPGATDTSIQNQNPLVWPL